VAPKKPPDSDFSESDRAALEHARQELQEHQHRAGVWSSLGRVSKWVLAAIAGVTVIADAVVRVWKSFQ
jgi:hypothetical protein